MLSSISPFGERSRSSRWWITASAYTLGSIAGGATTGAIFGILGQAMAPVLSARTALAVLAIAAVAGTAADLGWLGMRLPTLHRQVNEDWLTTYRGWVYGVGFGYQLGLGLATVVATSTVWLTWIAAAMSGSWRAGLLLGALFGLARGAVIFVTVRIHDPAMLRALFRRIAHQAPAVHRMATITAALTALTAIGGVLA